MHYTKIAEEAIKKGLLVTEGKTPEITMYAQITRDSDRRSKRGVQPRFTYHGKGLVSENRAVVALQLSQQLQPRQHHAAPLVVAGQFVPVHDLAQPILHHGRVDVIVVSPAFIAGVIRWVDVDAFDLAVIDRQQRLETGKIVAFNNQIAMQIRTSRSSPKIEPTATHGTAPPNGGSPQTPCP